MTQVTNTDTSRTLQVSCNRVSEVEDTAQAENAAPLLLDANKISNSASPIMDLFGDAQGFIALTNMMNHSVCPFNLI